VERPARCGRDGRMRGSNQRAAGADQRTYSS
jgi:hypothetical protein